ncbi:peptidylprolyl isomerase [Prevotella sp. tf2-5]|uniref:peptidylprolyl isomerase n=1 Tax=Prevotella sp. tf2-5 TaxID=1761889 RepID=UPI0008E5044B|nr:peptidylprolyl isomerase [Prevotella sp. tf2-5]SFO58096.1 periplasmic chaperone for outer membrane proteins SurA [Prevotella sp. tf2-5]
MKIQSIIAIAALLITLPTQARGTADSTNVQSVVDEVIWVVGDEAILKSDVETMRIQGQQEGMRWKGDPDCAIPEQIAVQKLYLHQAAIDSIEVTEAEISAGIEQQIEYMISVIGSREKLEEYQKKSMNQIRSELRESFRDRQMIQSMQRQLVKDITVTPADVRRYFEHLPQDSIPFVPTEVEVQIIAQTPRVDQEEINRVKDELRDYTDRVNRGETSFQTLARLYSEDPGTARRGGELGYTGRGTLDQSFANVAFNLTDPKKVSKIVESEFGFHIIQLIDKRGDKVNVRHILRKPVVSQEAIDKALARLDSIRSDIREGKFSFEAGASMISDDKDTRNNNGLMANATQNGRTSRFQLQDLPPEVARAVDTLKVGDISEPFQMINARGKTVCVIAKLKSRSEGHKATITEDFQVMKDVVLEKRRQEKLHEWVVNKIKATYVRVNDRYKDCQFEYQGWIK